MKKSCIKAIIFDYIGTLVNCKCYTMDASRENLYVALSSEGFDVSKREVFGSLHFGS